MYVCMYVCIYIYIYNKYIMILVNILDVDKKKFFKQAIYSTCNCTKTIWPKVENQSKLGKIKNF